VTNPRQRRQLRRLATLTLELGRVSSLLVKAYQAAELTLPDGYPAGGGETVSGGDISNPTLGAVIQRERTLESTDANGEFRVVGLAAVDQSLATIELAVRDMADALSTVAARIHKGAVKERTNMAECAACGRTVSRTPDDRLRSDYCTACYHRWRRDGQPDRFQFERARHTEVSSQDASKVFALDRGPCIEITIGGITKTLSAVASDELRRMQAESPSVPGDELRRLHAEA